MAIIASCSKSVSEPDSPAPQPPVEEDLVPVTFASAGISVETKAAPKGLIEGTVMKSLDIGVYGVVTEEQVPTGSLDAEATFLPGLQNKSVTTGVDGSITFSPKIYYPIVSDKTYSFYGYYPYSAGVVAASNSITAEYDLGDTDILWDEDHAEVYSKNKGFNAAYVREISALSEPVSERFKSDLKFQHVLTALEFKVTTEKEATLDNVKIKKVTLNNVATKAKLYIVSNDPLKASGTVEQSGVAGTLFLESVEGVVPTNTGADMGTLMLLPGTSYEAEILLTLDGVEQSPVKISLTTNATDGQFKAGSKYTLKLKIKSPVEVTLETALTEWKAEEGGEFPIG